MALTQVSTDGVKNDAITKVKIPANQIEASELADNAVDTNAIANNAVTAGKLASGVQTTINNNSDNRVITGSGSANTLEAESNLTFNGTRLTVTGDIHAETASSSLATPLRVHNGTSNTNANTRLLISTAANGGGDPYVMFDAGGSNFVIGNRYAGTTNNILCIGEGSDVQTVNGMFIKANGNVGIGSSTINLESSNRTILNVNGTNNAALVLNRSNTITGYVYGADDEFRIQAGAGAGNVVRIRNDNGTIARFDDNGLKFNDDTAAANALDDYEEGTFTPTQPTVGFNSASGHYTKIGRQVTVSIFCTLPTNSSGQAFVIDSMPFTSKSNSGTYIQGGYVMYTQYTSQALKVLIHDNSTRMQVYSGAGTDIALTNLDNQNFRIQLHYTVS